MWKTMKERLFSSRIRLLLSSMTSIATALSPPSRGFMDLPFAWLLVLLVHFCPCWCF
nr:hypothetical protein Iba_scaffold1675846CG0010 [Ipomoea batatas]